MLAGWWLALAVGAGPNEALAAVEADLTALPAIARPTARYAWLGNLPAGERTMAEAALGLAVNLASRRPRITRWQAASSDGSLWRLDLESVGWPVESWETVIREGGEPYFHLRTEVLEPGTGKRQVVFTDGGWLDLERAARVRAWTGSAGAVTRGDWLFSKIATTFDGGFYYDLAGVAGKSADEIYGELGIDFVRTNALLAEGWANLWRSAVTGKARRIRWRRGALGSAYKTEDYASNTAEKDPFRNPLGGQPDASEHFVFGPTEGLPRMLVFDGANRLQRTVPDVIAKDHTDAHGNGGILAPWLSCVTCHRQQLLEPFVNDERELLAGGVDLLFSDRDTAERAAAFYERDLERQLARDREDWGAATAKASGGLEFAEAAEASGTLYRRYAAELVGPERAREELGIEAALSWPEVVAGSSDPVWLALGSGRSVQRKQFEASFAEAALRVGLARAARAAAEQN